MVARYKLDKLFKTLFVLSIVFFVSTLGYKFYLCSSITVKNEELEQAFSMKKDIEEDISRLKAVNSSLSSISYIEKRSSELGFIKMDARLISLDLDSPTQVALIN
jgi:Tfp pilus assembly protein PilO